MSKIADSIRQQLRKFKSQKIIDFQGLKEAQKLVGQVDFPKPEDTQHLDPVHAAYIHVFNTVMALFEQMAPLPEIGPFYDVIEKADEEYMPKGPPWSPLTGSYFNSWGILDLRVGKGKETFASVILSLVIRLTTNNGIHAALGTHRRLPVVINLIGPFFDLRGQKNLTTIETSTLFARQYLVPMMGCMTMRLLQMLGMKNRVVIYMKLPME